MIKRIRNLIFMEIIEESLRIWGSLLWMRKKNSMPMLIWIWMSRDLRSNKVKETLRWRCRSRLRGY